MSCIFCKIIEKEIPSERVYEDDDVIAIKDIKPVAPVHILIMPKAHIEGAHEIDRFNSDIMGKIFEVAAHLAKQFSLDGGYRIITNVGEDGGQTVNHMHFHLIGGKKLGENII